jgi:hypothetical protein
LAEANSRRALGIELQGTVQAVALLARVIAYLSQPQPRVLIVRVLEDRLGELGPSLVEQPRGVEGNASIDVSKG